MMIKQYRMLLRAFALILLMGGMAVTAAAQSVKGIVKDASGEPMMGVSVVVKNTSNGTVTGIDGRFQLNVKNKNAVLVFSFLGYTKLERPVPAAGEMTVEMTEDNTSLNEVVVVGYQEVRKRDLTGSVAKPNMGDLLSTPVGSFDQTLGGRIAGVNVNSSEGMPGASMNIVIRGNNSLTQDNSPLYVIDGFPVEDPSAGAMVNPSDIASIDILKDASATAIYGARGANGVVIITTKSGREGKAKITYDGSVGWQNVTRTIPMMDAYEFVKLQNELFPEKMKDTYLAHYGGKQWTLDDYRNIAQYNWQDMIFRTAATQNHNLSVTGGNASARYNASLSYYG